MFDTILTGVNLPDGRTGMDVGLQGGRIVAIERSLPAEAGEAIDGTGRWRKFWRVTMPQLRNTTFFLSITVLLNSVQVFDIINVMTRGGPQGNGTQTLVFQIYNETFVNFRAGYGATAATILFLILLIITLIQVRIMDKRG